ncbi:hypothetical protein HCN44_010762 [Aphidius gifuensis]|uniref:Uncharacterized protein n=1 Tax=Aphidius gifuensis TaxID=684658 RepID=A0A834XSE7_APHGI|nr:uncharacterized protein LOC122855877 [Aphidius gifuensis]KAF7991961.1 hypothetical protein HCN44_010762 [Aphidius gifuensis]
MAGLLIKNIAQQLNTMVTEESESLCHPEKSNNNNSNPTSFIDILRQLVRDDIGSSSDAIDNTRIQVPAIKKSTNRWAESMAKCKLELVFLQCTVWLKHLAGASNYIPSDELMKIIEGLDDEKLSKINNDTLDSDIVPGTPQLSKKKINNTKTTTMTTPQRTWPGKIDKPLGFHDGKTSLIPSSEDGCSQQSADLFDSQSLPDNQISYYDSGMHSMLGQKTNCQSSVDKINEQTGPPVKKKKKNESLFVSSAVLSSFLANHPFNNIGLQVVRVLLCALERKDTFKYSRYHYEEIKEAVDAIINFINCIEKEEDIYYGYVSFCVPVAVDSIEKICFDYDNEDYDDDIEEMERLILMKIILELCNIKSICERTISMIISKIHSLEKLYTGENKLAPSGIDYKIMGLGFCVDLVMNKYLEMFLKNYTETKIDWKRKFNQSKTSENFIITIVEEFKLIYKTNRLIFPQFGFLIKDIWKRLVEKIQPSD